MDLLEDLVGIHFKSNQLIICRYIYIYTHYIYIFNIEYTLICLEGLISFTLRMMDIELHTDLHHRFRVKP